MADQIDAEATVEKRGRVVSSRLRRPFIGMSYHHAPVRPRRAEEKRTHPAELTGFILLTVTAICTAKINK